MDFNKLLENYKKFNVLTVNTKNEFDTENIEPFFNDSTTINNAIKEDINYSKKNSKFFSNYRIPLNTTLLADALVSRFDNGDTDFFPELALMFLKTYTKEIFENTDFAIDPKNLIAVFNKNQELVELPYPVALLLGGLYYFQENEIIIGDQSPDKLFNRINGVVNNNNEVYNNAELYRKPGTFIEKNGERQTTNGRTQAIVIEEYKFPSVRLLNRSLYPSDKKTFKIKTGVDNGVEIIENVNINTKSTMPAIGFGIQNKFLNYYNKTLFGEYLNGSKTEKNDGLPNVLAGGYGGILKPLKTYNSDEIEFTAFYRNLFVSGYSYPIDLLVAELDEATKNLKKLPRGSLNQIITADITEKYENDSNVAYIKAFLVYSKLKANFLSGNIDTKENLKKRIAELCNINNIDSQYNTETNNDKLTDFYFLVSHVFFTSFHRVDSDTKNDLDQPFDLKYRLSFGVPYSVIYRKSVINNTLYNILNQESGTKEEQINSLTNFLYKIWSLEKSNLKQNYRLGSKSTFAIYPSAGGFISPNSLLINSNKESLGLSPTNRLENKYPTFSPNDTIIKNLLNFAGKLGDSFKQDRGDIGLSLITSNEKMVDPSSDYKKSATQYGNGANRLLDKLNELNKSTPFQLDDPKSGKYLLEKGSDRVKFLVDYCFNNHSILNNTTRFFWFENNSLGNDLKLDRSNENGWVDANGNTFNIFYENENGIKDAVNTEESNLHYFRNINLGLVDHKVFKSYSLYSFNSNYDFNRLMDSINIEKLIDFSEEFKKFAKISVTNNNSFNLNSLIKASTIIKDSNFEEVTTNISDFKLTGDDITLLLIGNSMYNYEFVSKCGLATYLNIALTTAQKFRCESVVTEFSSNITTVANKSAIDSVTKLGDFELSIHNFHSSPEVLFTNTKTYEELKGALQGGISDLSFNKLIARRILFGEQFVPSYTELTQQQKTEIESLNKSYLYSKIHHPINIDTEIRYDEYYVSIVKSFFKYLNIRYTKENYKQLLKLIRGYSYLVSSEKKILNIEFLPNTGIVDFNAYQTYIKQLEQSTFSPLLPTTEIDATYAAPSYSINTPILNEFGKPLSLNFTDYTISDSELNNFIDTFFFNYNKTTFESVVNSLNGFLDKINNNFSTAIDDPESSFINQNERENLVNSFKKTTYYNVKSLYDKISTSGFNDSSESNSPNVFIPSKVEDIKNIEISDYLKNTRLFYNYKINPNICGDSNGLKSELYDLYEIFQVVDRGNNDIGSRALGDLIYLYNNLYSDFDKNPNPGQQSDILSLKKLTNTSIQGLLSGLAQTSGFLFQQIPNYLNINGYLGRLKDSSAESIYDLVDELFGVHTDTSLLGENRGTSFGGLTGFPGYIFQLGTLSSKLSATQRTEQIIKNDHLDSFCLDVGYDNNREVSVKADDAPPEILRSNVTCFTVDFGKQNQQMFNSVQLDTSEFYDTEESIRAWVDLTNSTQQTTQSANIFPILEKRSYSCTVTGLGNATIQPLSYFYLRNVPLFHGTYWITNVSHDIKPNTMMTTFKGVRQPISSKIDIRKQLIYLFREHAKLLKEANKNANIIQTEGIPNTSGEVFLVSTNLQRNFENNPYGYVIQKTTDNTYYKFDGITVVASFIVSITKTDDYSASNMGLINVLYNQSRAFTGTDNHADVIKNMKNIAIGIMNEKAESGDTRYANSTKVSLSRLVKENEFSTTSRLFQLLSDISRSFDEYKKKDDLIKLDKDEKIFSVKANDGTSSLGSGGSNNLVEFSMDSVINSKTADNLPISESTFYIEDTDKQTRLNTKIDGVTSNSEDDNKRMDILSLFKGLGDGNSNIRELNKPIEIKKIGTDNTTLSQNTVKFLGSYAPGKVAFFTSNNGGDTPYGKITWANVVKEKYKLIDATQDELSKQFEPRTLSTNERDSFVNNLAQIALNEFNNWNPEGQTPLKEDDYSTNNTVRTLLDEYWSSVTGKNFPIERSEDGRAWSAAFISYIVKTAGPTPNDFKYSTKHAEYIVDARDNTKSWKAYSSKDTPLMVGDLLCRARPTAIDLKDFNSEQNGHCDCVTALLGDRKSVAQLVGGNLDDTVNKFTVDLNTNGTVKDKNRTVILRFEPTVTLASETTTGTAINFSGTINELLISAGYEPNSPEAIMAASIATIEGWANKNSLAYKNNNPGNLDYSDRYKVYDPKVFRQQGNTKQTSRFAVFSKAEFGIRALIESKIKSWADGRMPVTSTNSGAYINEIGEWKKDQPPTFLQFFYTYAPPTDNNNPRNYAANVVETINKNANKKLTVQSQVKEIFS